MTTNRKPMSILGAFLATLLISPSASAQRGGPQGPQVVSPEVSAERKITFRILAPSAQAVKVGGGDIPGIATNGVMAKGTNGVWEVTVGPVNPGAYRYNQRGRLVRDRSRSAAISESNNNVWSLVHVPGAEFMDTFDVPHGAIAAVTYYSKALGKFRRMHVYTPPGYEKGKGKFPVFYLLHGAGDSDDAWTSVGRAGNILDNLIAAGKAKPMVVVMPAGHTRTGLDAAPGAPARHAGATAQGRVHGTSENDILPHVEKKYGFTPTGRIAPSLVSPWAARRL
jgi:enterochelin esterase family protein